VEAEQIDQDLFHSPPQMLSLNPS